MAEGLIGGAGASEASENRACGSVVQCADGASVQAEASNDAQMQSLKHTESGENGKESEETDTAVLCGENTDVKRGDNTVEGEKPKRKGRGKDKQQRRLKGTGGLQLEKTGMYTVRCIINGTRVAKSTGTKNKEEAERFLKRFLAPYVKDDAERTFIKVKEAVATERQLAEMREDENPQLALDKVWEAYDKSLKRRDLAQTTLAGKQQVWGAFLEYMHDTFPEAKELRHVSIIHAEAYLTKLRHENSAQTYNQRLCVLREMHRVLMEDARCKINPWEDFKLRPDDSHTRRELTVEELARLIDMASREGFEWRCLFAIGMYTGMRLGDCCKLLWSEVDIVRSIIQRIPDKTKKYRKGKPITVPIHRVLSDLLMQTPKERRTGYVLPGIGPLLGDAKTIVERNRGMSKIQHHLGKIFHNAGIVTSVKIEGRKHKAPDAGFHSLRHTFVSMSANAGVPLHIVQSIVGHESNTMTRHYFHENVAALQKAVEAIPSISEVGEVSAGEVAQPDAGRMFNRIQPQPTQYALPQPPPLTLPAPTAVAGASGTDEPIDIAPDAPQAPVAASADGKGRESTGADAPLVGRSAARNAVRREAKLAAVETANRAAVQMGGWGLPDEKGAQLPTVNRRQRQEWISKCVRKWCLRSKLAILEGTTMLLGNGGYRFLQKVWDGGTPMLPDEAVDAMEVFLRAKGVKK